MKNPMDRQLEKKLSDRAVVIGREGNVEAFGELLELLRSSSANARRLAASAMGKLAWLGVDQAAAVAALAPVARRDAHAQTRQYAIKAFPIVMTLSIALSGSFRSGPISICPSLMSTLSTGGWTRRNTR